MPEWDSFDAYLFDLDGTLLHCKDAVHYFGFCHALECISGVPLDLRNVVAHGNTDLGILRDALTAASIPSSTWRPLLTNGVAAMEQFVASRQDEMLVEAIPGAADILSHLRMKGAVLGVATGNLSSIGMIKLRRAGLEQYFVHHGFSDGLEAREDVFRHALQQMRAAFPAIVTVCIVGDTPNDVQAAHANGTPVIAVAGGIFSQAELSNANPDYCIATFKELLDRIERQPY